MSAQAADTALPTAHTSDIPAINPDDWFDTSVVSTGPNPNPVNYAPPQTSPDDFDPATMIDLRSFGALGDGSDATAAIQEAESYADSHGKSLFFDSGTYEVSEVLRVSQNERWVAKAGSVVLQADSGLNTMLGIVGAPAYNGRPVSPITGVSFSGLTFAGAASGTGVHSPLIVGYIADGLSFTNCTVEHVNGIGVLLSNVVGTNVSDCSFLDIGNAPRSTGNLDDASQGIAFCSNDTQQPTDNNVTGCTFTGIGLDAISASDQQNFTAKDNVMSGLNVLSGWDHWPQAAAGVYLLQNVGATVAGNTIQDASGNGIDVIYVSDLAISDNTVTNSGEAGIAICDVSDTRLTSNVSLNNNQLQDHFPHTGGITIAGDANDPSSNVFISGNTSSDTQATPTQDWGLQIDAGTVVSNLTVDGTNSFTRNILGAKNYSTSQSSPESAPARSTPSGSTAPGASSNASTQCFHASTRLLTVKGERQVSDLKIGDILVLATAPWASPITRIVKQSVNALDHRSPADVMPIRVTRDTFGTGRPAADLLLSPDHSIYTHGYLIPVKCLVNGTTIRIHHLHAIDYWRVEFPQHGVILAQGLAVESFLDLESLVGVAPSSMSSATYSELMERAWQRHACAPQLRQGPALDVIRHQLWQFARAAGWQVSADPQLALVVDGCTVPSWTDGGELYWELAGRVEMAVLTSATFKPAHMSSQPGGDERTLGVAVSSLKHDQVSQRLDTLAYGEDWNAAEPGWRWTNGNTRLSLLGVRRLSLRIEPWSTYLVRVVACETCASPSAYTA